MQAAVQANAVAGVLLHPANDALLVTQVPADDALFGL